MNDLIRLVTSPLLPPLFLLLGTVALSFAHPTRTYPPYLRWIALGFMLGACGLLLRIAFQSGVSIFAWEWSPHMQTRFQLIWINVGWNWYVSFLAGVLGITGLLIAGRPPDQTPSLQTGPQRFYHSRFLSLNLATVAIVWLLVTSANMLSLVYMWIALDVILVMRHTLTMHQHEAVQHDYTLVYHRSLGLGLLSSLVLLIGLFPAGINGPAYMLVGTSLPAESIYALLVAAAMRAGAYPLHFWLVPSSLLNLSAAERIFSHILPALTGLWLLGQTLDLAVRQPAILSAVLPFMALTFCLGTLPFLKEHHKSLNDTFVLASGVSLTALAGTLAPIPGTRALLLPLTAFALGSTLWIVAQRMPVQGLGLGMRALGAASLLGLPLTPGFVALAEWFPGQSPFQAGLTSIPLIIGLAGLSIGVSRPLARTAFRPPRPAGSQLWLLAAAGVLAILILITGLWPNLVMIMADSRTGPPVSLGASARSLPLLSLLLWGLAVLAGICVTIVVPAWGTTAFLARFRQTLAQALSLEWMSNSIQFGTSRLSLVWSNMMAVLEGAGFMGWTLILLLLLWTALQ